MHQRDKRGDQRIGIAEREIRRRTSATELERVRDPRAVLERLELRRPTHTVATTQSRLPCCRYFDSFHPTEIIPWEP